MRSSVALEAYTDATWQEYITELFLLFSLCYSFVSCHLRKGLQMQQEIRRIKIFRSRSVTLCAPNMQKCDIYHSLNHSDYRLVVHLLQVQVCSLLALNILNTI